MHSQPCCAFAASARPYTCTYYRKYGSTIRRTRISRVAPALLMTVSFPGFTTGDNNDKKWLCRHLGERRSACSRRTSARLLLARSTCLSHTLCVCRWVAQGGGRQGGAVLQLRGCWLAGMTSCGVWVVLTGGHCCDSYADFSIEWLIVGCVRGALL